MGGLAVGSKRAETFVPLGALDLCMVRLARKHSVGIVLFLDVAKSGVKTCVI
jgi:hypothetical protein